MMYLGDVLYQEFSIVTLWHSGNKNVYNAPNSDSLGMYFSYPIILYTYFHSWPLCFALPPLTSPHFLAIWCNQCSPK